MWEVSEPKVMHAKNYRTFCVKCRKIIRTGQQYQVRGVPVPFRRQTRYEHWHYPECPVNKREGRHEGGAGNTVAAG